MEAEIEDLSSDSTIKQKMIDKVEDDANYSDCKLSLDILKCSVCSFRFQSGLVYQCIDGHIACSKCRKMSQAVCPICNFQLNIRCHALESIISSLKVPCVCANYGCKEFVSYLHYEDLCSSAPRCCPIFSCTFQCQFDHLITHIDSAHTHSITEIVYDFHYFIHVDDEPYHVLYGNDSTLFLLLNKFEIIGGNSLSIVCLLHEKDAGCEYQYELKVDTDKKECLWFKAFALKMLKWEEDYPQSFLFVPDAVSEGYEIRVDLCIREIYD